MHCSKTLIDNGVSVLLKTSTSYAVIVALLVAVLSCLCWVQLVSDSCHTAPAMANCCCGDQPEVNQDERELPSALPATTQAVPIIHQNSTTTHGSCTYRMVGHARISDISATRASPQLYQLNTSFLI